MNQIYWMLDLIPDAVLSGLYWAIIIAGITGVLAGWLGKWIPFYGNYVKVLQPLGIVLLVLGVWLRGGYDTEMAWRERVSKLEAAVKIAEEKSQQTNTVIQEKIVEKTKIIKEKGKTQIEYIDRVIKEKEEVKIFIEKCPIPQDIIIEHNKAVDMNKAAEGPKK
jgi:hypothetical protein